MMNVLVVDDDKLDRIAIRRTLAKSNLQVAITEALTVDEGLDIYAKNDFDVVLLDYRMPQRDGIEMIVEIRNEPKDTSTAIVMMSSSEDEELAMKCIEAGAQDFLVKSELTENRLRRAIQHATTRFELEKKLYHTYQKVKILAETDALTGLPNRYFFDETLKQSLTNNRRKKHKLALLLLDLDNFKVVNDTFGHDIGDQLLKKTVDKIKNCLRGNEIFARLGGDEFAITLSNLESSNHANLVARRIIESMQSPIEIENTSINATVSIGVALHPDNGDSSESLFKYADIAMYRAKKIGRNQVCFFEEEMQNKFLNRVKLESELKSALAKEQFKLFFQPVVNPASGEVKGFEALLRWKINDEIRAPNKFINIAEETQQITPIGLWVAKESIKSLAEWNKQSKKQFRMAINVSPIQLHDEFFLEKLQQYLCQYKVAPHLLDIELTETVLFEDTNKIKTIISKLHSMGCHIALDDFGTGFSSLSHLKNYPITTLKIDKSLMPKNKLDSKNIMLVEGVVSMAKVLQLNLVAEGVENKLHADLCNNLQVKNAQGFYFAKPMPYQQVVNHFINPQ